MSFLDKSELLRFRESTDFLMTLYPKETKNFLDKVYYGTGYGKCDNCEREKDFREEAEERTEQLECMVRRILQSLVDVDVSAIEDIESISCVDDLLKYGVNNLEREKLMNGEVL